MRWKTTLVLLVAAVGLGAYVALVDLKRPTPDQAEQLAKRIVDISPEDATTISVEMPAADVQLERRDDAWRMTAPLSARAEASLTRRILSALDPLEAQRTLDGSATEPLTLADYGLHPPQGSLTVTTPSQSVTLLFGEATAVGHNRYLRVADSQHVYVIGASLFDDLNQSVQAYRSHELLPLDTWRVTQIAVTAADHSYRLERRQDQWHLIEPIADAADLATVSTLLSKLRGLRITQFVTDAPEAEQLSSWGLEAPPIKLQISQEDDAEPLTVAIGHPPSDHPDQRYARRSDESTVYTVDQQAVDGLLHDPMMLRSQACFSFFASHVTKVELAWQDASWMIERREGQWRSAGEAGQTLDGARVEELLWQLRDLNVVRVVEDHPAALSPYGLEPPAGSVQVWTEPALEPERLLIGSTIQDGQTRYGYLAARDLVAELPADLDALLTRTPASFAPDAAVEEPAPSEP